MGDLDWDSWIGIGALLLGGAAVLWGVANGKIKLQLNQQASIEERLARYPVSAGAVVIKGQPGRAWSRQAPALLLGVALALAMPYVQRNGLPLLCDLSAAEAARWTLLLCFPVMPAVFALAAVFTVIKAVRVLRGGYSPPLDTVLLQDTIAVTGWRAKLHGTAGLLVMPLLMGGICYLGYEARQAFDEVKLQTRIAAKCAARQPGERPY